MVAAITIPLMAGRNYISFWATSTDNFGTIFTTSGIKANIQRFFTYDSILRNWVDISDSEYIDKGKGYILDISSQGNISYIGEEYILTFDELRSRLIEGLNLVGPGSIPITSSNWCRVIDASTEFSVTQLQRERAYWIYYSNCQPPVIDPLVVIFSLGLGISILSLWISLKKGR